MPTIPTRSRAARAAVVAAALLAAGCSSSHRASAPTTSPAPTTPAVPSTTSTTVPAGPPAPYLWARSSAPALAVGGGATTTIGAILSPVLSQPWTVAGTRLSADGTPSPVLWTSPDARDWQSSALSAAGTAGQAADAAEYQGRTVVVGSIGQGPDREAAVWYSAGPGLAYQPVPVPATTASSAMTLVAAGALGFFATGTIGGRFALWTSTDGTHWSESAAAEKAITALPGVRVHAVLAEGTTFYAAGSVQPGVSAQAALWSSGDGIAWHQVTSAQLEFDSPSGSRAIYSLAPLGTGLVAVGALQQLGTWSAASWISPDGVSWSQPSEQFSGSAASVARAVSAIFTFAGSSQVVASGNGASGPEAWRSIDGLHWTPITLPTSATGTAAWEPTLLAASTETTVLVDGDPGQPHVLVDGPTGWTEPSADPAVFGPVQPRSAPVRLEQAGTGGLALEVQTVTTPQRIGPATTATRLYTSTDGTDWVASPAAGAATPAEVAAATGQPPTLPALGAVAVHTASVYVAVGPAAGGRLGSWTSPTGAAWTAQGFLDPPVSGAVGDHTTSGLCLRPGGTGIVAVGSVTTPSSAPAQSGGSGTGPAAPTTTAAAWSSGLGINWHRLTVSPTPAGGATEVMAGCVAFGSSVVAFGSSTGPAGSPVPALWRSAAGGSALGRQTVPAFAPGTPAPLTALATSGPEWLAVADPTEAVGPPATLTDGRDGLWASVDSGSSWQLLATATAPWVGDEDSTATLVAFAAAGVTPVVAGEVDGELAVWTGTPVPAVGGESPVTSEPPSTPASTAPGATPTTAGT